jgi:hypothetical protein
MKKKSVAMNGNQRMAASWEVAEGDVVPGGVVGDLDRRLDAVRLHLHTPRDVDHHPNRQGAGQHQVEDELVDRKVDRPDLDRDPVVQLELVLGLELLVLALAAREDEQQDRDPEVEPHTEQDLLLVRER